MLKVVADLYSRLPLILRGEVAVPSPELTLASPYFTVHFPAGHTKAAQDVLDRLMTSYDELVANLRPDVSKGFDVRLYHGAGSLHKALEPYEYPWWVVGVSRDADEIHIVSPRTSLPHSYADILKLAVHELAHCMTARICAETTRKRTWLWESVALYCAGQRGRPLDVWPIPPFIKDDSIIYDAAIYSFGYVVMECLLTHYGWDAVRELIIESGDTARVLGITENQLYAAVNDFVLERYFGNTSSKRRP